MGMAESDEFCGTCHYMGWKRRSLKSICRHPDHVVFLKRVWFDKERKCSDYRNLLTKYLKNEKRPPAKSEKEPE